MLTLIQSLSARRAWIEMSNLKHAKPAEQSLSARRAWIEIKSGLQPLMASLSLSARRAWIEIASEVVTEPLILVALRKESVDRNIMDYLICRSVVLSLSARRAWIEMGRLLP